MNSTKLSTQSLTPYSIIHNVHTKFKNNQYFGLVGNKHNILLQSCTSLNSPYTTKLDSDEATVNTQRILTLNSSGLNISFFKNYLNKNLTVAWKPNQALSKVHHSHLVTKQFLFETLSIPKTPILYTTPNPTTPQGDYFDYNNYTPNYRLKFTNQKRIPVFQLTNPNTHKPNNPTTVLLPTPKVFTTQNTCQTLNLKFTPYIKSNLLVNSQLPYKIVRSSHYQQITTKLTYVISTTPTPTATLTLNVLTLLIKKNKYRKPATPLHPQNNVITPNILIKSRSFNKLVLNNAGLFILNNYKFYNNIFLKPTYKPLFKMRKSYYSFIKPNQVKSLILKRKASLVLYKIVTNQATNQNITLSNKLTTLLSLRSVHKSFPNNPSSLNHLPTQFTEVKLPRVKFKPGYQRLWRESRTAFKDLLGVKFLYQQKLTKYISHFIRKSNKFNAVSYELTLDKLIVYSKVLPDYNTFKLFYGKNIIFINGKNPTTPNISCVINDFIQLVVLKWYYVFYRWLLNWSMLKSRKLKRLVYRKGLSSRYTIMKSRKQRSYSIPDWIFSSKYDFSDVKPFLEVDYFSLSFFVLYEPYTTYYYTPTKLQEPHTSTYKLYNWKYIT